MRGRSAFLIPVLVVLGVIGLSSIFIVDEREKALVLQFGQVKGVKTEPGLYFKLPLIQNVVTYDDRILSIDTETLEVTPLDDRRLVVDAFARYRIADVIRFRQAVGDGGVPLAERRLERILRAKTREVLGSVTSNEILSKDRATLMARIRDKARTEAEELGVEVIDVRLKRTDLPEQNLSATYARMRAEREREAADEIARGKEAAQKIRAQADRTKVELVSEARRKAEVIRGEADARRTDILARAYGADPDFFSFWRTLKAYTEAIRTENSALVLSPDGEFFTFFKEDGLAGDFAGSAMGR